MLAFDDAALARLVRGARQVSWRKRGKWLRELARELDPPAVERSPDAVRQVKVRANRKAGKHCYQLWVSDRAVEGLIMRLVLAQRLTERQALQPRLVALALAALLEEEGQRCAR